MPTRRPVGKKRLAALISLSGLVVLLSAAAAAADSACRIGGQAAQFGTSNCCRGYLPLPQAGGFTCAANSAALPAAGATGLPQLRLLRVDDRRATTANLILSTTTSLPGIDITFAPVASAALPGAADYYAIYRRSYSTAAGWNSWGVIAVIQGQQIRTGAADSARASWKYTAYDVHGSYLLLQTAALPLSQAPSPASVTYRDRTVTPIASANLSYAYAIVRSSRANSNMAPAAAAASGTFYAGNVGPAAGDPLAQGTVSSSAAAGTLAGSISFASPGTLVTSAALTTNATATSTASTGGTSANSSNSSGLDYPNGEGNPTGFDPASIDASLFLPYCPPAVADQLAAIARRLAELEARRYVLGWTISNACNADEACRELMQSLEKEKQWLSYYQAFITYADQMIRWYNSMLQTTADPARRAFYNEQLNRAYTEKAKAQESLAKAQARVDLANKLINDRIIFVAGEARVELAKVNQEILDLAIKFKELQKQCRFPSTPTPAPTSTYPIPGATLMPTSSRTPTPAPTRTPASTPMAR